MRKQNSIFQTGFLSEAGSELENNDYFACVELDNYACYVAADGLNSQQDAKSARIATQSVILAFQEKPSLGKRAIRSYLKAADKALCQYDSRERLKASVMVVVTDYEKMRYGWAGNTRLRMYRDGQAREQSQDMSLGSDETKEKKLPEDVLLSRQPENLENYTLAAVFAVLLCISLGVWFFRRWRQKQEEELEQRFSKWRK